MSQITMDHERYCNNKKPQKSVTACQLTNRWHFWVMRSVLFFSHPRSEGWPHDGRTFSIIFVVCHSDWLFHSESCPRLDVVHPGRVWSSSPACIWHCSLHNLSPGNSFVSSWCDHSMLTSLLLQCLRVHSHWHKYESGYSYMSSWKPEIQWQLFIFIWVMYESE